MMLQFGPLTFSIDDRAYETLRRKTEYRWPQQNRLLRRPALQSLGIGSDSITLTGVIHTLLWIHGKYVGAQCIEQARKVAANMTPYDLMDGRGNSMGRWVIKSIENADTDFFDNGAPRKQNFTIDLHYYGEDNGDGAILFAGGQMQVPQLSINAGVGLQSNVA